MMKVIKWFVRVNRSMSNRTAGIFSSTFTGGNYASDLKSQIVDEIGRNKPKCVMEVGGVDRPMLERHPDYHYVGLDIEFASDCIHLYDEFLVQSIEQTLPKKTDMIVSITLLEHVPDNSAAVASMFNGLNPGGTTHHYIPSGLHPYSIALRLVGPKLQKRLIPLLRPGTEDVTGYPAFFDHCTPGAMQSLFKNAGFVDIQVKPYFRANDYFAFFFPAYIVVSLFENMCKTLGLRIFASGFTIKASHP